MDTDFSYYDFEGCIAHFKANPPTGATVELDFSPEKIQSLQDKAARYDCTLDVFLVAVIACFVTELSRRDRLAEKDCVGDKNSE